MQIQNNQPKIYLFLDWRGALLGLILGVAGFLLIYGSSTLDGANIGWLYGGDPLTYYLNAAFFQQTPWTFPPGLNPAYGLEIPSAIGLSDAIPLFGFIYKLVYSLTGKTFQYLGIWLCFCFAMQGFFGWLLASQHTKNFIIKFSFSILVIFMPAFLARGLQFNHYPLSAHYLILAAFLIFFSKSNVMRGSIWGGLFFVAVLSNTYIFAMVVSIWAADLVARYLGNAKKIFCLVSEFFGILFLVVLTLWLSGFFTLGSGYQSDGFGLYRANLLSIFDSRPGNTFWSYFLPGTPKVSLEHNAPNFLGSGSLIVIAASIFLILRKKINIYLNHELLSLSIIMFVLLLFSLSNKISIGSYEFIIPINSHIERVANLLRDSGRFTWPLGYLLLIGSLYIINKAVSKKIALSIFLVAALVQLIDTHRGWKDVKAIISARQSEVWPSSFNNPFWDRVGGAYQNIRMLPAGNHQPRYEEIAYFALLKKMKTNAVYLSRSSQKIIDKENARFKEELNNGDFDQDTVYLLDDTYYEIVKKSIRVSDFLDRVNGFWVFAPGWYDKSGCMKNLVSVDCPAPKVIGRALNLSGLNWTSWGDAIISKEQLTVSSLELVDSGLVSSSIHLVPGMYRVTTCLNWNVVGPISGAAHVSIFAIKKIHTIQTSSEHLKCLKNWLDIADGSPPIRLVFGLGGWSLGSGEIGLKSIKIEPLN
jgi:hypothetical protein